MAANVKASIAGKPLKAYKAGGPMSVTFLSYPSMRVCMPMLCPGRAAPAACWYNKAPATRITTGRGLLPHDRAVMSAALRRYRLRLAQTSSACKFTIPRYPSCTAAAGDVCVAGPQRCDRPRGPGALHRLPQFRSDQVQEQGPAGIHFHLPTSCQPCQHKKQKTTPVYCLTERLRCRSGSDHAELCAVHNRQA